MTHLPLPPAAPLPPEALWTRAGFGSPAFATTMPNMATILVADDNPEILRLTRDVLEHAGFSVITATDGRSALQRARGEHPDLIVLDLGLPDLDGLDVARSLRRDSTIPIIMLTARADESDTLVGLELGADDYVTKPFSPKELVARIRAVLRRSDSASAPADHLRVGELELDVPRMATFVSGRRVELTPTEFQILAVMARQPGRVFTRSQLLDAVHGVAFESYERAIDAHVKNIRHKLEPNPREPRFLQTVFGVGYRVAEADQ
jgi:two-component system, OmpR family, alkaline phosphatase synthesis response regulator PhoP